MITVALPTWNNKNVLWLPLEGLCRQKTTVPWELIVHECGYDAGAAYIFAYEERLRKAGCVDILYIHSNKRLPLSYKWIEMAKRAKGKFFCLQGSDDYPHPSRNQRVWDADVDWYDCRKYYQYHVLYNKLILYDYGQTNDMPREMWRTGFNMAIRTELMGKVPLVEKRKSVDGFLMTHTDPKTRFVEQEVMNGVSTTGVNSISVRRFKHFINPQIPFYKTNQTIKTIGLPDEISDRLINFNSKPKKIKNEVFI